MSTALSHLTQPWYRRWWSGVLRAMGIERPTTHLAGADYATGYAGEAVSTRGAQETLSEFEWVYACVAAIASDLATLPIRVSRSRGRKGVIDGHPFAALLEQPSARVAGVTIRQQLVYDLLTTGSGYLLKVFDARGRLTSLLHLPADRVEPVPGPDGLPQAYRWDGGAAVYAWSAVIHVRRPSWRSDPSGLRGQGVIEALRKNLAVDWSYRTRLETAGTQGRPSAIVSPEASPDVVTSILGPDQIPAFREEIENVLRGAHGGVAILGSPVAVQELDWKPTDLGAIEVLAALRAGQLGAFGVPPARLGLETANYATAREQMRGYWSNTVRGVGALIDAELTATARRDFGDPLLEVWHDYAGVPELQEAETERLDRIAKHISNGMDAAAAYAYEGLSDAPIAAPATAPAPAPKAAPEWTRAWSPLRVVKEAPAVLLARAEPDRDALWQSWLRAVHQPAELRLRRAVGPFLAGQARRIAARVDGVGLDGPLVVRDFLDDLVARLVPAAEEDELAEAARESVRQSLIRAFAAGADQVGRELEWAPVQRDAAVEAQLGRMVQQVTQATRDDVRRVVLAGIGDGLSAQDIAANLRASSAFTASRALAIARTEATRSVSAGHLAAGRTAESAYAVTLRKDWLSARDTAVRVAHVALDGLDPIPLAEPFRIGADTAQGPGDFAEPANVVNCRCALRILES